MTRLTAALAVLLLAAPAARADYATARQLVDQCRSREVALNFACSAYITGVADLMLDMQGASGTRQVCIPPQTTRNQLRDTVLQAVLADRSNATATAATAVSKALIARFPCS